MPNTNRIKTSEVATLLAWRSLGTLAKDTLQEVIEALNKRNTFACQLTPEENAPIVNIGQVEITLQDGRRMRPSPLGSLLPNFSGATINTFTGATSINVVPFDFPEAPDADSYVRMGLTLVPDGTIVVSFNNIDSTIGGEGVVGFPNSGLPIGYVDLRSTGAVFPTTQWRGATSVNDIIENSAIVQFMGAGGGGGEGDANELLERLKNRLQSSPFEYVTPVIFSSSQDELIDTLSSTAAFDVAQSSFAFNNIGDELISLNMFDEEFLQSGENFNQVELIAYWQTNNNIDAVYEISIDNGLTFEEITMQRIGGSDTHRGVLGVDQNLLTASIDIGGTPDSFLEIDNLTFPSRAFNAAEAFSSVSLDVDINVVGSPVGLLHVRIVKDIAGFPSPNPEDIIATSVSLTLDGLSSGSFPLLIKSMLPAGDYHLVFITNEVYADEFSASSGSNKIEIASNVGGLTSSLLGFTLGLKVKITASAAELVLRGFGIFYKGEEYQFAGDGTLFRHVVRFNGLVDNEDTFELPFTPDPRLLSVYQIGTAQVFRIGAFTLQGSTVFFEPNTFQADEEITLEFIQLQGTSFDNSDFNASLLAANHLGSPDLSIDLSANGRGIFLRRPDGVLREISINDKDELEVYSV
jgi:hypothetical protein